MGKHLLHLRHARVPAQKQQMEKLQRLRICPFCRKNFEKHHKAPILKETKHWLVTKNDYPYEGTKMHLLLVHKQHIESLSKISDGAFAELGGTLQWAEKRFKIKGGSYVMRFGDMKYTGATIAHLHAHIIMGVKESAKTESIKQKVGFKKK